MHFRNIWHCKPTRYFCKKLRVIQTLLRWCTLKAPGCRFCHLIRFRIGFQLERSHSDNRNAPPTNVCGKQHKQHTHRCLFRIDQESAVAASLFVYVKPHESTKVVPALHLLPAPPPFVNFQREMRDQTCCVFIPDVDRHLTARQTARRRTGRQN